MESEVKTVLVIRCGALGDLVYTTSVIEALRLEYGASVTIDFVCTPGSGTLFKNDPRVRRVFPVAHKRLPLWLDGQKRTLIRYADTYPYDLLINLEDGLAFRPLAERIAAKRKVGAFYSTYAFDFSLNRGAMLKRFFADAVSPENLEKAYPKLPAGDTEVIKQRFSLPPHYVVLAPSNSHVNKKGINYRAWPQEHWRELTAMLAGSIPVVLVGAKGEEAYFEGLQPYGPGVISLVGRNSLGELVGVIAGAEGVVCTDSAVGHIAAAVNTPVFVLMGPNDPVTDSPYRTPFNSVTVLSQGLECSPCYKTGRMKACRDNVCMRGIAPERVYEALQPLLAGKEGT